MKYREIMHEAPLVIQSVPELTAMVANIIDDFIKDGPTIEQLAALLRVAGKELSQDGRRSTINSVDPSKEEAPFR